MIRLIDIRLNAAHPDLPLCEAVTYTGAPSTVLIRGVPGNCGRWCITSVYVAATFPDGSTSTRLAVQSANGVWVATLPATATSGRTANGVRIMADGEDENGEIVTGYILGVADFAVASLGVTPAPEPGETSWQMLYFDTVPGVLRKGDVAKVDGVLKMYNGTAWEPFADLSGYVPTSRTVNGKALTDNVSLSGADIPVDATQGAQRIDAALAGKRDKTDLAVYELAWTPGDPAGGGEGTKFTLSGTGFTNPLEFPWDAATSKWKAVGPDNVYISRTATGFHCDSIPYVFAEGFDFSLGAEHTYNIVDGASPCTITGYTGAPVAGSDTLAKVSQLAGKQDALTFDNTPTTGSSNPVKSSGVWSAIWGALTALPTGFSSLYGWVVNQLAGKLDKSGGTMTGDLTLIGEVRMEAPVGLKFNLPSPTSLGAIIEAMQEIIAPVFTAKVYFLDELCTYNNKLYVCDAGYTATSQSPKPDVDTAHWVEATVYSVIDYISRTKANKPATFTTGNLAALDASGNPVDAGYHFEVRHGIPCIVQYT